MNDPVQFALEFFKEQKRDAEIQRAKAERRKKQFERYPAPKPSWFQIATILHLKKIGQERAQNRAQAECATRQIQEYQDAIDGINRKDYEPAILLIERILPSVYKHAKRQLSGMLYGSAALAEQLEEARGELILLSTK